MTTTPAGVTDAGDTAELQTEAAELQADITEAKQEAQQARQDGDDERAARIEAAMNKQQAELDEIKTLLKGLTDRPFHPAPGDDSSDQGAAAAAAGGGEQGAATQEAETETAAESKPKKGHWLYGDRWNQD